MGYYLAGLIAGDGSITLRKGAREKTSPKIVFTFHSHELALYNKLNQTLQTGIIYTEKREVCRYTISNADVVIKLISLMSSKYLNYLCFLKATQYLGKRLFGEEILEIRLLKESMNNKRTVFD